MNFFSSNILFEKKQKNNRFISFIPKDYHLKNGRCRDCFANDSITLYSSLALKCFFDSKSTNSFEIYCNLWRFGTNGIEVSANN